MSYALAVPGDISEEAAEAIRRAFREAYGILAARGRRGIGRAVEEAIIGAVRCGCLKHSEMVAIGLAAGSTRAVVDGASP